MTDKNILTYNFNIISNKLILSLAGRSQYDEGNELQKIQQISFNDQFYQNYQAVAYSMGPCLEIEIRNTRFHNSLGELLELQGPSQQYLLLILPLLSEEEYVGWSKSINKLRCSQQINNYLYLPRSEKFIKRNDLCESSSKLELSFISYNRTLSEELDERRISKHYYTEIQLWYLLYVLTKYIRYFQKQRDTIQILTLENILIDKQGSIKIIPKQIIPHFDVQPIFNYKEKNKKKANTSNIYEAGLIVMWMANLESNQNIYDSQNRFWCFIERQVMDQLLNKCKQKYSSSLISILREMTELQNKERIKSQVLISRLQQNESQILKMQKFGLSAGLSDDCKQFSFQSMKLRKSSAVVRFQDNHQSSKTVHDIQRLKNSPPKFIKKPTEDYLNIL